MIHVAIDIGASSGRLVSGYIQDSKLVIQEEHRFENNFKRIDGVCYWDVDYLLNEILVGLEKLKKKGLNHFTVGIDTWAVDYVLVDKNGQRLREAISYRDSRTKNSIEKLTRLISKETIYKKTGIQFQPFNTLFQLFEEDQALIEQTDKILLIPDYLGYCLSGKMVTEQTNASTTQLLNVKDRTWDEDLLNLISVRKDQFPRLIEPGTILGKLDTRKFPNYELPECEIITVATHDTSSAVVGTPGAGDDWAFLSSGTWSLIGVESKNVFTTENSYKENFTNEWGVFRSIRFLKNVIGMWIIQEVRRLLDQDYSFSQIVEEAEKVLRFDQFINFNDNRFLNPANMIEEIQNYCVETGQKVPYSVGELASCIYTNLAIIYAIELDNIETITNKRINKLHIVGGGANNELLNQLTADISGRIVYAGPTEATAIGNIILQMIAVGELSDLKSARKFICESFEIKKYNPRSMDTKIIIDKFKEATNN